MTRVAGFSLKLVQKWSNIENSRALDAAYPSVPQGRVRQINLVLVVFNSCNTKLSTIWQILLLYPGSINIEQEPCSHLSCKTKILHHFGPFSKQPTILSHNISPEPPNIILFILSCLDGPALCRSLISDSQLKAFVPML